MTMEYRNKRGLAIAACMAAVFIWGASFVAIKVALASFHPMLIIFLRTFIGVIVLLPFLQMTEQLTIPLRKEIWPLFLMGLIGVAFYQWLQAVGVQLAGASQTSWVTASAPVFIVLLGWFFLKERIHRWQVFGLCLALGGALLVVSSEDGFTFSSTDLVGPLILFVSALVWAGYSVLAKYLVKDIHPLRLTFYSLLIGLIFLGALVTFTSGWALPEHASIGEWIAVAFLGFGSTGVAYIFYFYALKWAEMTLVAVIQYLEPLITMLLAAWLVEERMIVGGLVGGVLILSGVWLVNRSTPQLD
jgi:drug/metabolite transporter (DMT)-like permease